ncbi:MAG: hypothetical protein ACTIJ6_00605 [Leucobacter sp.]
MGSYEDQLKDLAYGESWEMTKLGTLIQAVERQQQQLQKTLKSLPEHWKGQSSETLVSRLNVHHGNLEKLKERLYSGQQQVTGNGQFTCAATCDNTERKMNAQAAYENLSSSHIPTNILDQIGLGAEIVEVVGIGPVDLAAKGVGWITDQLSNRREEDARKAVEALDVDIRARAKRLTDGEVTFDPLPTFDGTFEEVPPLQYTPPAGNGPGGGVGGGPSGNPGGSGGPGGGGTGGDQPYTPTDPTNPNDPYDPRNPTDPTDPTNPRDPYDPRNPYDPRDPYDPTDPTNPTGPEDGGGDGPGDVEYPYDPYDPSQPSGPDSGVDDGRAGHDVRSGVGAAGLGGVGLAAGAKLAKGGFGGLGGFGGAGAGAGSGLVGTTGAGSAGSGSGSKSGAGAGASSKAAGAGRPGGMMMGAQGGGSSSKKGAPNKLGYVADKFEDEYEENMPHPSSRAGKRTN